MAEARELAHSTGLKAVRQRGALSMAEGLWDEGGRQRPCTVTRLAPGHGGGEGSTERPATAEIEAALASLRAEAQVLALLGGVAGVPRLLSFDAKAGLLVQSRPDSPALTELQPGLQHDVPACIAVALALADLVSGMHAAGVTHGALQPAHLHFDAARGALELCDFSQASLQSQRDTGFGAAARAAGQPFAAPEQRRSGARVDYRADHHALGAVLHWLLCGRPPAEDQTPAPEQPNPGVGPGLWAVVTKLLAREPAARYQSARALRLDLERCRLAGPNAPRMPPAPDHRTRPLPPSRLFGRDAELARLERALQASAERRQVVTLHGPAGSGASALLRALGPALAARGAVLACGRCDPLRSPAPLGALDTVLADLAAHALAEPAPGAAPWREQLAAALGDNAPFLASLAPAFAPLLPPATPAEDPSAQTLERLQHCLAALVGVYRARELPLLIFVADLQWADGTSLALLESLASGSAGGLLLVLAYRDSEFAPGGPLHGLLARLAAQGDGARSDIALAGLTNEAVRALVVDMLDAEPAQVEALARTLRDQTGGKPGLVAAQVAQWFATGQLRREAAAWRWEAEALRALAGDDAAARLPLDALRRLPDESQTAAAVGACLADAFDPGLLAQVLAAPTARVDEWLLSLQRQDMLVRPDRDRLAGRLQFGHRAWRQAARGLLDPAAQALWQQRIARVLLARLREAPDAQVPGATGTVGEGVQASAASAGTQAADRWLAAEHCLAVAPQAWSADERRELLSLWLRAARDALGSAALDGALRLAEALGEIQDEASPAEALACAALHHEVLLAMARREEADEVFAARLRPALQAVAAGATPAGQAGHMALAVQRQLQSLTARRRHGEALQLAHESLAAFGLALPAEGGWQAALEHEMAAVAALLQGEPQHRLATLAPAGEPGAALLLHAFAGLDFSSPERPQDGHALLLPPQAGWGALRALRVALEQGGWPSLPVLLIDAGEVFLACADDDATAAMLGRAALQRLAAEAGARTRQQALLRWTEVFGACFEPLPQVLAQARRACSLAVDLGQPAAAARSALAVASLQLEGSPHADHSVAELDRAALLCRPRGPAGAGGLDDAAAALEVLQQFVRCLQGRTAAPGSLAGDGFDAAQLLGRPPGPRIAPALFLVYRAWAAALFGDWPAALAESRRSAERPARLPGHVEALRRWVHAMALCHALRLAGPGGQRLALQQELAPQRAWLARRAAAVPANFGHMLALLDALAAWAQGELATAMGGFERSADAALEHGHAIHHALACELSAAFCASLQQTRAADAYRAAALHAFEHWGASGKVAQLRAQQPPRPEAAARQDSAGEAGAAHGLDLAGVVQASQLLAQERDAAALSRVFFELSKQHAPAERGLLFWQAAGGWRAHAGFGPDGSWAEAEGSQDASAAETPRSPSASDVPASVLQHLQRSLRPLLLPDVSRLMPFARDATVLRNGVRSIVGLPIHLRGEAVGLLYLENRAAPMALAPAQLETLRLVGLQFAVAFEHAQTELRLARQVAAQAEALQREHERRQRAEQAAAAASRAQGEFLSSMGHEIRTPMNAILGMSHLALRSGLNPQQRNYVQKVERSAESLLGLINDILDFSKIEAGQLEIERRPFRLGDVMDKLARLLGPQAEEKGLELLFVASPELPDDLVGDPLRLAQVLSNLGHNAIRSTDRGEIIVTVEETTRWPQEVALRFTVSDTGVGLSPEKQRRLLQPLLPNGEAASPQHDGTSLGLAISHHLVTLMNDAPGGAGTRRHPPGGLAGPLGSGPALAPLDDAPGAAGTRRHPPGGLAGPLGSGPALAPLDDAPGAAGTRRHPPGGRIGLRSEAGQGSSFFFEARFGLPASAAPVAASRAGSLKGARVLVVDDNPSARRILAGMGRSLALHVEDARDGWDGLRAVTLALDKGQAFDVVLMDWKMPTMDGVECARQMLANLRDQAPAIVMMTAFGREEMLERLHEQQVRVSDVLTKPVTPSTLFDACAVALGHAARSGQREARRRDSVRDHRVQLRGARLLLVEDNPISQELALELLSDAGIVVTVAGDGQQAIAALGQQRFDGVLMDCQMPVMDGYEATRAIRGDKRWGLLPVIAMTANAMAGDREKALAAGMNDHIAKPIDVQLMFDTIARWVRPGRPATEQPRPAPAAQSSDPLASLPGIEASIGRASTMGNDKLYLRLLGMFREGQRDFAAQFRAARAAGDAATAMRLAHNLRTVSASLGAQAVAQAARELESACNREADSATLEALLVSVERDLLPVVAGLSKLAG